MFEAQEILEKKELDLGQRLGLLNLAHGQLADQNFFGHLQELIRETIAGSRISEAVSARGENNFEAIEIVSEDGTNLGRLTMIYLTKPIPYYYLIYVEVAWDFRRKGLGTKVIKYFQQFLETKGVIGILDNIIPVDDPTYVIYEKAGWQKLNGIGAQSEDNNGYMIYKPLAISAIDPGILPEVIFSLNKERAVIDIKHNEDMVKQTIWEFKALYQALIYCFQKEIAEDRITALARFMFTRFVTKLVSFRRRIENLVGYTGGESLEQICLDERILNADSLSYFLKDPNYETCHYFGHCDIWRSLPENIQERPVQTVESLPNYPRPILTEWLASRRKRADYVLKIGDILELGFDPTRLKQITVNGRPYIFERIQKSLIRDVLKKQELIKEIGRLFKGQSYLSTEIKINPALLIIVTESNAYVLRSQLEGVHYEEAIEQLLSPALRRLNEAVKCDALILKTLRGIANIICEKLQQTSQPLIKNFGFFAPVISQQLFENFAFFIPWNLEAKQPRLVIDAQEPYLQRIWIA